MTIKTKFLDDGGVLHEGLGVVSDDDLEQMYRDTYRDEEQIKKIKYRIFDVSKADKIEMSTEQVIRKANMTAKAFKLNPNMRVAVFGNPDLIFGLGRMWTTYACDMSGYENNCKVFREMDKLVKWVKDEKENT
ncbi:MAG: hypothetical protein WBB23_20655 [Desulforhopalus sp.]